jgi:hypothetical protein
MATPIELITAPGKYYYDLSMEETEALLKLYHNIDNKVRTKYEKEFLSKKKYYHSCFKQWEK